MYSIPEKATYSKMFPTLATLKVYTDEQFDSKQTLLIRTDVITLYELAVTTQVFTTVPVVTSAQVTLPRSFLMKSPVKLKVTVSPIESEAT
jgi:hypothetical protein